MGSKQVDHRASSPTWSGGVVSTSLPSASSITQVAVWTGTSNKVMLLNGVSVSSLSKSSSSTGATYNISFRIDTSAVNATSESITVGTLIKAQHLNNLSTTLKTASGMCLCHGNYCSCDCNYCSCDCNYCSCNCNYCSCNCNYCSCDCNYCSCDCNNCSCQGQCSCNSQSYSSGGYSGGSSSGGYSGGGSSGGYSGGSYRPSTPSCSCNSEYSVKNQYGQELYRGSDAYAATAANLANQLAGNYSVVSGGGLFASSCSWNTTMPTNPFTVLLPCPLT